MTLDDLTVNISHLDQSMILSDWQWLIGVNKLPILVCAIGDVFLQDSETGVIDCLDVSSGEVLPIASDVNEFRELLSSTEFVVNHFAVQLVGDLLKSGLSLASGEVFSFKKPLALGGDCVLENIEPTDLEVHFSIYGQIHEQIKNLPDGVSVDNIKIG